MIDHINRISGDDRIGNLRLATHAQNMANSRRSLKNTSGYKGVSKQGNRYKADIRFNGRTVYLGRFDTPKEAHLAYCEFAKKYRGEFACFG